MGSAAAGRVNSASIGIHLMFKNLKGRICRTAADHGEWIMRERQRRGRVRHADNGEREGGKGRRGKGKETTSRADLRWWVVDRLT